MRYYFSLDYTISFSQFSGLDRLCLIKKFNSTERSCLPVCKHSDEPVRFQDNGSEDIASIRGPGNAIRVPSLKVA